MLLLVEFRYWTNEKRVNFYRNLVSKLTLASLWYFLTFYCVLIFYFKGQAFRFRVKESALSRLRYQTIKLRLTLRFCIECHCGLLFMVTLKHIADVRYRFFNIILLGFCGVQITGWLCWILFGLFLGIFEGYV